MEKFQAQKIPPIGDVESRGGFRDSYKRIYAFVQDFIRADQDFKDRLVNEITTTYGDSSVASTTIGAGASGSISISVPGAQPGYAVEGAFDNPVAGVTWNFQVVSPGTVQATYTNTTGGSLSFSGKLRVYVHSRVLA